MKVAIVHDWLVNYGGAERVLEQMLVLYPDADIFTLVYDKSKMAAHFPPEKVHPSMLQKIPKATKIYTKLLYFMPKAFEAFDFSGYDLVIASSSSCAKGIITPSSVPYVAYIHSPMRYAWDLYHDYLRASNTLTRFFMRRWIPRLRQWDYISSQRIDSIVANSAYIARRIKKFWNREAEIIHPPVDVERLSPNGKEPEDFFVAFSRFVPYKRLDLAIQACGKLGKKLIVIGGGSQENELKALAAPYKTVSFTGKISDDEVKDYLQRCRALIFCAEEDFGIIPVEVQACGRPVVAFGRGGALETVIDGKTGVFFKEQTLPSLVEALQQFESMRFSVDEIVSHAQNFSNSRFRRELQEVIRQTQTAVTGQQ